MRMRKSTHLLTLASELIGEPLVLPYAEFEQTELDRMGVSPELFQEFEARYQDPAERRAALFRLIYGGE